MLLDAIHFGKPAIRVRQIAVVVYCVKPTAAYVVGVAVIPSDAVKVRSHIHSAMAVAGAASATNGAFGYEHFVETNACSSFAAIIRSAIYSVSRRTPAAAPTSAVQQIRVVVFEAACSFVIYREGIREVCSAPAWSYVFAEYSATNSVAHIQRQISFGNVPTPAETTTVVQASECAYRLAASQASVQYRHMVDRLHIAAFISSVIVGVLVPYLL